MAPGPMPLLREADGRGQQWQLAGFDGGAELCAAAEFEQVPEQAETGDVGKGMDVVERGQFLADGIQLRGGVDQLPVAVGVEYPLLHRAAQDADAQRLAEDQHVAIARLAVALDLVRMHQAQRHQAVDRFRRVDRVAAGQRNPGAGADTGAPGKDLLDGLHRQRIDGHADDGQRQDSACRPWRRCRKWRLVAAMRPKSNGSSTMGMKKSVVATSACESFRR